jgi:hypothetical protein
MAPNPLIATLKKNIAKENFRTEAVFHALGCLLEPKDRDVAAEIDEGADITPEMRYKAVSLKINYRFSSSTNSHVGIRCCIPDGKLQDPSQG